MLTPVATRLRRAFRLAFEELATCGYALAGQAPPTDHPAGGSSSGAISREAADGISAIEQFLIRTNR